MGIQITLNGESIEVAANTIAELIIELNIGDRKFAVERNLEIVTRSTFAQTQIVPGDKIEVIHFVGGG